MDFIYMKKSGRKRKNVSDYDRGGSGGGRGDGGRGNGRGNDNSGGGEPGGQQPRQNLFILLIAALITLAAISWFMQGNTQKQEITYSKFLEYVEDLCVA